MKKKETVDLSSLNMQEAGDKGVEIELLHPATTEPLGVFITVIGKDSTVFNKRMRKQINANLRRETEAKRKGKNIKALTIEELDKKNIDTLAACTTGWRNMIFEGKLLEFTQENVKKIYADQGYAWLKDQVDEAIADRDLFMKA